MKLALGSNACFIGLESEILGESDLASILKPTSNEARSKMMNRSKSLGFLVDSQTITKQCWETPMSPLNKWT